MKHAFLRVGTVNKLSLISKTIAEIRIKNQLCKGIYLTNMIYACPRTYHVWQPFAIISQDQSGSHLSLVHVFHMIPYTGLSMASLYTIPLNISSGMVGYRPTTTIIKLCRYTGPHKSSMRSSIDTGGATTLELWISNKPLPVFPIWRCSAFP
jgi:hypothetical protein